VFDETIRGKDRDRARDRTRIVHGKDFGRHGCCHPP